MQLGERLTGHFVLKCPQLSSHKGSVQIDLEEELRLDNDSYCIVGGRSSGEQDKDIIVLSGNLKCLLD